VREAAIAGLAELGPAAVPGLVAHLGDEAAAPSAASSDPAETRASVAAIRALSLIRPEGTAALAEIADDHPSAATRAAARLALGRPLVEPH
jgi:HEAT repeat protein